MDLAIATENALRSDDHRRVIKLPAVSLYETGRRVHTGFAARFSNSIGGWTIQPFCERHRLCQRVETVARECALGKDRQPGIAFGRRAYRPNNFGEIRFR